MMSRHSQKSKQRHPDAPREHYEVAHITFEIAPDAKTFALIAGQAYSAKGPPAAVQRAHREGHERAVT